MCAQLLYKYWYACILAILDDLLNPFNLAFTVFVLPVVIPGLSTDNNPINIFCICTLNNCFLWKFNIDINRSDQWFDADKFQA